MELKRLFYYRLLPSWIAILFCPGGALGAAERCRFQRGETSVVALCEQGCCQDKCCTAESSDDNLTILIIVCIAAVLIIIALIIVFLAYFFKDRQEDRDKKLAERAARDSLPAEDYDIEENHRQGSPPYSARRDSTFVTSDNNHSQPTRCKSGTRRNSSARATGASHDKESARDDLKSSPTFSSHRKSTLLVHEQDLRIHESGGGVQNSQRRPKSTPTPGRRKNTTHHLEQESPRHDSQTRRNSQARLSDVNLDRDHPLSSSLRPVSARKKNTSVHFEKDGTQEQDEGQHNSESRRGSKSRLSDAFLGDEDVGNSPVSSSSPPTARRMSRPTTLTHHDHELNQQGAGSRRNSKARTSDAFLQDMGQGETLS